MREFASPMKPWHGLHATTSQSSHMSVTLGLYPVTWGGGLPPSVKLTWFAGGSLVLVGSGVCASSELHQLLQHRFLTSVAVVGSSVSEF